MWGPIPDNLYDYDYNDHGLDHSFRGADFIFETRDLENLLDVVRYE